MDEKGQTRMDLLEEIEGILTDAGGPGEFKYDGGPKPYVKKDGTTSKKSEERVDSVNEGQQQTIPVPTEEQQDKAAKLVDNYYQSKEAIAKYKFLIKEGKRLFDVKEKTPYTGNESAYHAAEKAWQDFVHSEEYEAASPGIQAYRQAKHAAELAKTLAPLNAIQQGSVPEYEGSGTSENSRDFLGMYKAPDTVGGSTFASLNEHLANPSKKVSKDDLRFFNEASAALSEAIQGSTLKEDATVYRTVTQPSDFGDKASKHVAELMKLQKGDIFENKAFSSTTYDVEAFKNMASSTPKGVKLVISLKKGSKGFNFDQDSELGNDDEYEVLLDKGSKFRVDDVDKKSRIIKMTHLGSSSATDSIALDYTFIPEEHPRQKDPDWGGKPQEPGQSKAPLNAVVPTPEAHAAASEMVDKYYESQGKDKPSRVSMVKNTWGKVADFLGFGDGPEQVSQSRRKFLTKSMALVASQALPHVPGGDMLNQLASLAGVTPASIETPTPAAAEKAYSAIAAQITKKWIGSFMNSNNENPFEEMSEEYIEQAGYVKNAEDLKSHVQWVSKDYLDSLRISSTEMSEEMPIFLKQFNEHSEVLKDTLRLAGETEDNIARFFTDKKELSYLLAQWKSAMTDPSARRLGAYLNEKGQVVGKKVVKWSKWDPETHEMISPAVSEEYVNHEQTQILGEMEQLLGPSAEFEADQVEEAQYQAERAAYAKANPREAKAWEKGQTLEEYNAENPPEEPEPAEQAESAEVAETESIGMPPGTTAIATKVLEKVEEAKAKVQSYIEEIEHPGTITDAAPLYAPNYRFTSHELQYVIESLKGTLRTGHGFQVRMPADYGYIVGFIGADGDEVDCYLGPNPWSQVVYVVDQNRINSPLFDEHKCLIGFASEYEAKRCYLSGHHMGDKIFRGIKALSMREFMNWLTNGDLTKPITK